MNYYKITLGGRGSEVYPFELNEEQYESLLDGNVETDGLDYDDICQILNVESYFITTIFLVIILVISVSTGATPFLTKYFVLFNFT